MGTTKFTKGTKPFDVCLHSICVLATLRESRVTDQAESQGSRKAAKTQRNCMQFRICSRSCDSNTNVFVLFELRDLIWVMISPAE